MSATDRLSGKADIEDYIIHRDESEPGRVEFSRATDYAPKRIAVSLKLLQDSGWALMRVGFDELTILNDTYRVVGWLPRLGALDCELVAPQQPMSEESGES